jgi:glycine cleavage system H protein
VVEVNAQVSDDHSLVNKAAETTGWLAKIQLSKPEELKALLNKAQYEQLLKEQDH